MGLQCAHVSDQHRANRWLRHPGDPLERLRQHAASIGPRRFSAGGAVFELHVLESQANRHEMTFRWTRRGGSTLPPVTGLITAAKFGPFACLTVRGRYAIANGIASALVEEAVGPAMLARSLANVLAALESMLKSPPPAAPGVGNLLGSDAA